MPGSTTFLPRQLVHLRARSFLARSPLARTLSTLDIDMAPVDKTAPPAQNTAKRDFLIALEQKAQKRWHDEKLFEQNSPYATGEAQIPSEGFAKHAEELRKKYPKVLATMPYPVRPSLLSRPSHTFPSARASEPMT